MTQHSESKLGLSNKTCLACEEFMSVSHFPKSRKGDDGYDNVCKACKAEGREPVRTITHKECKQCLRYLPVEAFDSSKKHLDGYGNKCKECKKYNQFMAEKKWRTKNKKKIKGKNKRYQSKNPEYMQTYYHQNKESIEQKRKSPYRKSQREIREERAYHRTKYNKAQGDLYKQKREEMTRRFFEEERHNMIYPGKFTDYQEKILQDNSTRIAVLHGRRAGISTIFNVKTERFLRSNPKKRVLFISATDPQAQCSKNNVELFLKKQGESFISDREKIVLKNQAYAFFTSPSNDLIPELVKEFDLIIVEEMNYMSEIFLLNVIENTKETSTLCLFGSIPAKGTSFVVQQIFKNKEEHGFSTYQINGGLYLPESLLESLQEALPKEIYRREFLCQ